MKITTLLQTTRPAFLVLTFACVFLGLSTALSTQASIDLFMAFLVMAGAVLAHISVNTLNEYYDFKSGLDLKTGKTPFSGGSGALPNFPEAAGATLIIGIVSLALVIAIGIYFILERGMQILPIGLMGIILIIAYTPWINRSPFLCLLAPGTGFGILMVVGTHLVLTGESPRSVWLIALIPFFLVNNLLLLNQYPDIKADADVGRNTFPIAYGIRNSNIVYALFMAAPYLLILVLIVTATIPLLGIIALVPLAFAIVSLSGAIKHSSRIGDFPKYLGANVAAAISTPFLLGIAIVSG
jgi:1,4-dihydroxy-2-naphthoate octaprenyltransferase